MTDEPSMRITDTGLMNAAALILLGLALNGCLGASSDGISYTAARALGEEIAEGIEKAACIEARGEWRVVSCSLPDQTRAEQ